MNKLLETIVNSRCNLVLRVHETMKDNEFNNILNCLEKTDSNLICVFPMREKCQIMYDVLRVSKSKILYLKKQKVTLSASGNLLICTPERLEATLAFYPTNSWLSEYESVIFYDSDLLLNDVRGNVLEADIIRISRFNPFIRKVLITTDIENVETLAIWTKSCLIDFTGKGKKEYDSKFLQEENVLTQSLMEIVSSGSRTLNELKSFFRSSFAYFQGKKIPPLQHVLSQLIDHDLIIKKGNYYPTSLGKMCVGLHLPLSYQLTIISKLKEGVPPQILKKRMVKNDVYFHNWICHSIDLISKLISEKNE